MIDHALLHVALQPGVPDATSALLAALAPAWAPLSLGKGAPVLRQGELWQRAFLVHGGLVRMHFLRRDGKEFNKNFFAEGALVCPIPPAMWGAPSLFGISCVESCRLWQCDATVLRHTLQAHGVWDTLQRELMVRLLSGKLQREHDLLALDGRQRYEAFCAQRPELARRVPLLHLATYLGLTDVSLSRLRRAGKAGRGA